jgi:integrase
MVAMLIGCGLRRAELSALHLESIQQREEHWVIADLVGKAGHVRLDAPEGEIPDKVSRIFQVANEESFDDDTVTAARKTASN